ncbi:hypothetical protein PV-S19_0420 [Pacmanvirus S19]|nr:hypothetical protein PV-S19_0420 [Pacmanvirus S19]
MSYLDKILDGLPTEIRCRVCEYLIDLQQESARKCARVNYRTSYLADVKHAATFHRLVEIKPSSVDSAFEYHIRMYCTRPEYRIKIGKMLDCDTLSKYTICKYVGRVRFINYAIIAWNFLRRNKYYEFEQICREFSEYRLITRQ